MITFFKRKIYLCFSILTPMKKLFLSASFSDVASLFPKFAREEMTAKKVCFIPTASIVEEYTGHVVNDKKAFQNLGMQIDELEISTASIERITESLDACDYIFVSGGNTFYLLQELKNKNVDQLIVKEINKGKIYIGTSAGSIVMAPDIQYIETMDDRTKAPNLPCTTGLNLIDYYPLVHYKSFPFTEVADNIFDTYHKQLPLLTLSNQEVLLVTDNHIEKQLISY